MEGVHVETSQYGCIICEHKSKTKAHLKQHMWKVHTAATPETCQVFKKVVRRLYIHNYYWHGEKRFPCTIYGEHFLRKSQLETHMKKHRKEPHIGSFPQDGENEQNLS